MFSSSNALGYISFTSCPLLACVCGRLCVLVSRGALGVFVCGLILYSAVRPPTCWATGPEVDCRIQVDQWSLGQHTTDRAPRPALSGLCCLLLAATAACPSVGSVWFACLHVACMFACGMVVESLMWWWCSRGLRWSAWQHACMQQMPWTLQHCAALLRCLAAAFGAVATVLYLTTTHKGN